MIEVCCAIILNESKILVVQRGPKSSHPLEWEFPGGKVHPDETIEQCIVREIDEELNLKIEVKDQLLPVDFDYSTKQIRLIPLVCKIISGEITLTEHIALHWIESDEWDKIKWSGADHALIAKNQEYLKWLLIKPIAPDVEK